MSKAILRYGSGGVAGAVGALQQLLVESGADVDSSELAAGYFGASTKDAVEDYQARHTAPDGAPLDVDGVVGPATWWALRHPGGRPDSSFYTAKGWRCFLSDVREPAKTVLAAARDQIGVREEPPGSNRGAKVDVFTGMSGEPKREKGPPWCAHFLSWCAAQTDAGSPFGRLASTYKIAEWGRRQRRIVEAPEPGDIFCILRGDYHGHCGFVCHVYGDGTVATIEGNSSHACRGLIRRVSSFTAIVRPA